MARGEITEVVAFSSSGSGVDGATVEIRKRSNNTFATIYTTETGSTTVANPLLSVNGRIEGWLDEGSYLANVSKIGIIQPYTVSFEIVNGDTVIGSETAINAHIPATTNVHGTGVNVTSTNIGTYAPAPDLSGLATHAEVTSAVSAHEADTTNVHGIADTAVLVVTSDARLSDQRTPLNGSVTNAKVAAGAAIAYSKLALNGSVQVADLAFDPATQVELDAAVAPLATSAALTAHTSATTSVHGIADTSKLVVTNPGVVQTIQPTADVVPLVIKAKAGQTANLLALQDSTSVTVFSVASNGSFTASSDSKSSGSLTANVSTANQVQLGWSAGVTYSPSVSFGSADDTRITRTAAGELTLTANGANTTRFIVRGGASQSTNLQDWMQSGGTAVAGVDNSGNFSGPGMKVGVVGPASQSGLQASDARIYRSAAGEFTVDTSGSNPTKLIVKGTASQSTTPLFQIQNSAGAVQVTVDNTGVIDASGGVFRSQFGSTRTAGVMNYANTAGFLTAADATHDFLLTGSATTKVPLAVRGAASQTASLQEWQDSTPTVQAFIDPAGRIVSKAEVKAFNGATQLGNNKLQVLSGAYEVTGIVVSANVNTLTAQAAGNQSGTFVVKKGVSTQTQNLQEWQDDVGTPKSWITPNGAHYFGTAGSTNGAYIDGGVLNAMQGALIGTNSYVGRVTVKTLFATDPGIVVRGFASQSANLQEWQNSTPTAVTAVKPDGTVAILAAGKGIQLTSPDGTITKTLTLGNDGALNLA
jgi:hypothetical protein